MTNDTTPKIEGGKRCQGIVKKTIGDKPLVSIITAVYNGNATLDKTIKSVINQDYSQIEYLIIDGGSNDGTIETLKNFDDSIDYWVSEPDKGVYDAFNKGIDLANGEWLYFIGASDSFIDNHVLQRIFSKTYKSKLLYGDVMWGETGIVYDGKFDKIKLYNQNICQQAIFYNRELFHTIGKFDLRYPLAADWVFNIRAFAVKVSCPAYINTKVANYSLEGMSTNVWDQVFLSERDYLFKKYFGYYIYSRSRLGMIMERQLNSIISSLKRFLSN
jgi:glycosyltransferase involved in cell wall biosynthesis